MLTVVYAKKGDNLPLLVELAANGAPEVYNNLNTAIGRACSKDRSILIVAGPERISRNLEEFCSICEHLHNSGCQIYTPIGKINPYDSRRLGDAQDLMRRMILEETCNAQ